MCTACARGVMKATGAFKCAECRAPVDNLVQSVAALVQVTAKRIGVNSGVDENDMRFRWDVDYIAGVDGSSPADVKFLVQWKAQGLGRRTPKATWEPHVNLQGQGTMPEAFLRKHGFLPLSDPQFVWPVKFEVPTHKVMCKTQRQKEALLKCDKVGCGYTSKKRSNMQAHRLSQHAPKGQVAMRFPCPLPGCGRDYGCHGALAKHVKKAHDKKVPVESAVPVSVPASQEMSSREKAVAAALQRVVAAKAAME